MVDTCAFFPPDSSFKFLKLVSVIIFDTLCVVSLLLGQLVNRFRTTLWSVGQHYEARMVEQNANEVEVQICVT